LFHSDFYQESDMKRYRLLAALFAVWMLPAVFTGCSNDSPIEPSSTDEQFFQRVVAGEDGESRELITSDVEALNESADFNMMGGKFGKKVSVSGIINPVKFGRRIMHVERSIIRPATMDGDSVAIVQTKSVISGEFVIKAKSDSGSFTIRKPFTETLYRNLRFERVWDDDWDDDDHHDGNHHDGDDDDDDDGEDDGAFRWRLVSASIVNGGTENPSPVIASVELITAVDTFIVTDPDQYFMAMRHGWNLKHSWKHGWKHWMPKLKDVPITIRVTLAGASADTAVVALHHLESDKGLRKQMFTLVSETESGGVFTRVYERTWFSRLKFKKKYSHLVVSALSRASVYDDDPALYSSSIWGIPYLPNE